MCVLLHSLFPAKRLRTKMKFLGTFSRKPELSRVVLGPRSTSSFRLNIYIYISSLSSDQTRLLPRRPLRRRKAAGSNASHLLLSYAKVPTTAVDQISEAQALWLATTVAAGLLAKVLTIRTFRNKMKQVQEKCVQGRTAH